MPTSWLPGRPSAATAPRVAHNIFTSDEALGLVVQRIFEQILNRTPGAGEIPGRVAQLRAGRSGFAALVADLFTSGEFNGYLNP